MATKTSTKTAKTTKNSNVTSPLVIKGYSNLANSTRKAEVEFVFQLADLLATGKTSVRIAKASIKAAIEKSGQAPTFRASHVESVRISAVIFSLQGADKAKVSDVLKLADRIKRAYGVDEALLCVQNFEGDFSALDEQTPTQAELQSEAKAEAEAEPKAQKVESVESILRDTLKRIKGLGDLRALKTSDLEQLAATVRVLQTIANNSKAA